MPLSLEGVDGSLDIVVTKRRNMD